MSANCIDPMPDYIDPELVKLIAQNAPFELDLFLDSLDPRRKRGIDNSGLRHSTAPRGDMSGLGQSPVLRGNIHSPSCKSWKGLWRSCPDRLWSDSEEEADAYVKCRKYAVKRKKLTSSDRQWMPAADNQDVDKNHGRRSSTVQRTEPDKSASVTPNSHRLLQVDAGNHQPVENLLVGGPRSRTDVDRDKRNAKSWRHGMRMECKDRGQSNEEKLSEPIRCKRKAQSDSRTTSEVRKYMEFKETERKKERQKLKAETIAARDARKEQQRKLDLQIQALLQAQKSSRKKRNHTQRPAWVSECSNVAEAPHVWSVSSVESNVDLPAPLTPPEPDAEPLDLYSTRSQYAEHLSRPHGINLEHAHRTSSAELSRSRPVKEDKVGAEHRKSAKQDTGKNSFREYLDIGRFDKPRIFRKTRQKSSWTGTTRSRGRNLISEPQHYIAESIFPVKHKDVEAYERIKRIRSYQDGSSHLRAGRASSHFRDNGTGYAQFFPTAAFESESFPKPRVDHSSLSSKVKRLKPTHHSSPCEVKQLVGRSSVTPPIAPRGNPERKRDSHAACNDAFIVEKPMMRSRRSLPVAEQKTVIDYEAGRLEQNHNRNKLGTAKPKELILAESLGASSGGRLMDHDSKQNRGPLVYSVPPSSGEDVEMNPLEICHGHDGTCSGDEEDFKDLTGDVRHQRLHLLKSLAAQLVSQVNTACTKKTQLEKCVMHRPIALPVDSKADPFLEGSGPDLCAKGKSVATKRDVSNESLNSELMYSISSPGSFRDAKSVHEEVAMVMKNKEYSISHCDRLTEEEQAGCVSSLIRGESGAGEKMETASLELESRQGALVTQSGTSSIHSARDDLCPSQLSTHPSSLLDLPSTSRSLGTSPVILPTTTKFHMDRIKHSKSLSVAAKDQIERERKENWSLLKLRETNILESSFMQCPKLKDSTTLRPDASAHVHVHSLEKIDGRQIQFPFLESNASPLEDKVMIPALSLASSTLRLGSIDREDWRTAHFADICPRSNESSENKLLIAEVPSERDPLWGNQNAIEGEKSASLQLYELGKSQVKDMLLRGDGLIL